MFLLVVDAIGPKGIVIFLNVLATISMFTHLICSFIMHTMSQCRTVMSKLVATIDQHQEYSN